VDATRRQPSPIPLPAKRRFVPDHFRMSVYRFVPRVSFHPSYASALYLAHSQGFPVNRREHCVPPGAPPATVTSPRPPQLLALADAAGRIELRYRAATGGFFVVATTFDGGWRGGGGG